MQLSWNKFIPLLFPSAFIFGDCHNKSFSRVVCWKFTHPCLPSTFSVYISHSHTLACSQSLQATLLLHLGLQPRGFSWQSSVMVTGLAPMTSRFKNVFSVTEMPATCNPQYFNYPLVLANSEKKNALCGLAHLGIVASACSPAVWEMLIRNKSCITLHWLEYFRYLFFFLLPVIGNSMLQFYPEAAGLSPGCIREGKTIAKSFVRFFAVWVLLQNGTSKRKKKQQYFSVLILVWANDISPQSLTWLLVRPPTEASCHHRLGHAKQ